MRRFPPPRSGVRCASPSLPQGTKNSRARLSPAGSRLGPGRLQRAAVPLPVRGKGRGLDGHALGIRIPPHPCGECLLGSPFSVPRSDHPRIRGEKIWYEAPDEEKNGSPPRMRGTVLFCVIPVGMPPHGSPPPVRGKGGRVTFTLILSGITPAYAGKRSVTKPRRTKRTDHPRPCGEKSKAAETPLLPLGSPPPVRGKENSTSSSATVTGITPACAGKSFRLRVRQKDNRDHPRLCGEKAI